MKYALNFGILAAALAFASAGHAADLSGTWTYQSQACASGAAPNPAVEAPNGTITVVNNSSVTINATMSGCNVAVGPFAVAVSDTTITPSGLAPMVATCGSQTFTDNIQVDPLTYTLAGDLVSLKSPPEQNSNGACAMGDSQIVTYKKTN